MSACGMRGGELGGIIFIRFSARRQSRHRRASARADALCLLVGEKLRVHPRGIRLEELPQRKRSSDLSSHEKDFWLCWEKWLKWKHFGYFSPLKAETSKSRLESGTLWGWVELSNQDTGWFVFIPYPCSYGLKQAQFEYLLLKNTKDDQISHF